MVAQGVLGAPQYPPTSLRDNPRDVLVDDLGGRLGSWRVGEDELELEC